jgi:hypothetical protein
VVWAETLATLGRDRRRRRVVREYRRGRSILVELLSWFVGSTSLRKGWVVSFYSEEFSGYR